MELDRLRPFRAFGFRVNNLAQGFHPVLTNMGPSGQPLSIIFGWAFFGMCRMVRHV
jgi:hypothetical protein